MIVEYEFSFQENDVETGVLMVVIERGIFSLRRDAHDKTVDASDTGYWNHDVHNSMVWIGQVASPEKRTLNEVMLNSGTSSSRHSLDLL